MPCTHPPRLGRQMVAPPLGHGWIGVFERRLRCGTVRGGCHRSAFVQGRPNTWGGGGAAWAAATGHWPVRSGCRLPSNRRQWTIGRGQLTPLTAVGYRPTAVDGPSAAVS